ncbi:MAG: hypothetical protein CL760_08995 [Chloroflexi bacterium]|nr:hypothetical protein [Chloroflexota bacterium]|tara:strand:- start:46998 stop:47792 length:795 start_codon:yes stop_codon:yes gene_type:complete
MVSKEKLIKSLKNKEAIKIVKKVLNYNFKDEKKTDSLIDVIKNYLIENKSSLSEVHDYVKKNSLQITEDNEKERVFRKVSDLTNILKSKSNTNLNIKSILDIGTGNGNILVNLGKNLGIEKEYLYGVDTVDYTINNAFNHLSYDNNSIPVKDNSIDLITIMMVLHHTDNPLDILNESYRALSENGTVIIRETNAYNNDILEFNIIMEYIFYTILLDIPVSITENYLSDNEWEQLFESVGFKFEKVVENKLKDDPFTSMYYILKK